MEHTPCNLKRTVLQNALGLALAGSSMSASALLTTTSVLAFDPGYIGYIPNDPTGAGASWFSLQVSPYTVVYAGLQVGQDGGLHIGVTQDTNGHASHSGTIEFPPPPNSIGGEWPLHSGVGGIDDEWGFWYSAGMHFTTVPVTVVSDFGATKTLDFSGWNITWNTFTMDLGGGLQDCGTSTDGVCVDNFNNDLSGTFDNGTSLATITCSNASCSDTSTFTLDYSAIVPTANLSGFGGTPYGLHLQGHIVGVPNADLDGDGVPNDSDQCPDTPSGDVVNSDGCSIAQLCPCDGPMESNAPWGNHGQYVSCVAHAVNGFKDAGLLTGSEGGEIKKAAAKSSCGK